MGVARAVERHGVADEAILDEDALACPRCGGRFRLIALIDDPRVIHHILKHRGLPTEVPAAWPPRAPPIPFERFHHHAEDDISAPEMAALAFPCGDR